MTTRRPWIMTALWTTARSAVLHTGLGWRGRPRRPPCVRGVDVDRDRRSRRVEAGAAVDAQNAPTAACKTRGRVSHSSHNASSLSCTRSTRRDYNRARTQGGTHSTDSTTVATLRRVITITGLGVQDAPESPIKLAGMRTIAHRSAGAGPVSRPLTSEWPTCLFSPLTDSKRPEVLRRDDASHGVETPGRTSIAFHEVARHLGANRRSSRVRCRIPLAHPTESNHAHQEIVSRH